MPDYSSFLIEALSRLSNLGRKFLQQPQIAIGVAEADILHTLNIRDLADFKSTFQECRTRCVHICYDQVQAPSPIQASSQ